MSRVSFDESEFKAVMEEERSTDLHHLIDYYISHGTGTPPTPGGDTGRTRAEWLTKARIIEAVLSERGHLSSN